MLAFSRSVQGSDYGDIWLMNPDGTNQREVARGFYGPKSWSPDGSRFVVDAATGKNNTELEIFLPDGSWLGVIGGSAGRPSWSPNGSLIAFASWADPGGSSTPLDRSRLLVMNADGSGAHGILADSGSNRMGSWSPDGKRFVFSRSSQPLSEYQLFTIATDGSDMKRLTFSSADDDTPQWSPDGIRIAFARAVRGGRKSIYVINSNGAGETQLTSGISDDENPVWSPDGLKIAFTSYRDGRAQIYVMNRDGSAQKNLSNSAASDMFPAWWGK